MGLITAAISSAVGTMSDQWKDFFACDALSSDVLVAKGHKKGYPGSDNIITDGSKIAVADGQCMMITDQGKIVDVCSETGEYIYDMSSEPSLFTGNLSDSVLKVFETMLERFSYGGSPAHDQRIYYFNIKEIPGNKYGTPNPIPFRVVDENVGLDVDISIRCFGEYSYKITNPILFYSNVCGNVASVYTKNELDSQLKTELLTALQPAFAKISDMGIRYSSVPAHSSELADVLNEQLSKKWKDLRGIEIVSFGVSSITADEEDEKMIRDFQKNAAYMNPAMAAANLAGAQADAMKAAASNPNGAVNGFVGMNMAANAGGVNVNDLYAQAQGEKWFCPNCGKECFGNFCSSCGTKKP